MTSDFFCNINIIAYLLLQAEIWYNISIKVLEDTKLSFTSKNCNGLDIKDESLRIRASDSIGT